MDSKAIKELGILHEISISEHISQRYLSKELGMTAGLVNLYIRRLARKGHIKITGVNRRRLKYFLTPSGIAQKTRLTYEFATISYKYLKKATEDIRNKLGEMETKNQTSVVIFGTGELTDLCLLLVKDFNIRVVAIVDDNAASNSLHGYPVVPREILSNLKFDKMIVADVDSHESLESLIEGTGIEEERISRLLEVPAD